LDFFKVSQATMSQENSGFQGSLFLSIAVAHEAIALFTLRKPPGQKHDNLKLLN